MDRNENEIIGLNEQIADLKAEIVELSGKLTSGVEDDERAMRPAIAAVRENPGTVAAVAFTAGLIGVALGYIIGTNDSLRSHVHWH